MRSDDGLEKEADIGIAGEKLTAKRGRRRRRADGSRKERGCKCVENPEDSLKLRTHQLHPVYKLWLVVVARTQAGDFRVPLSNVVEVSKYSREFAAHVFGETQMNWVPMRFVDRATRAIA